MKPEYAPILLIFLLGNFSTQAEIVKCTMPDGHEVYTNQACDDGTAEIVNLPPFKGQGKITVEQKVSNMLMTLFEPSGLDVYGKDSSLVVVFLYLGMSIVSFCLYWSDKTKAAKSLWRIPENTLHLSDLCGGWPGGLIAQKLFRHKNRKEKFQVMFWITVIANVIVLADWNMNFLLLRQIIQM